MMETYKNKIDLIYIDPPYNTNRIFKSSTNRNNTISSEENGEEIKVLTDNQLKMDI